MNELFSSFVSPVLRRHNPVGEWILSGVAVTQTSGGSDSILRPSAPHGLALRRLHQESGSQFEKSQTSGNCAAFSFLIYQFYICYRILPSRCSGRFSKQNEELATFHYHFALIYQKKIYFTSCICHHKKKGGAYYGVFQKLCEMIDLGLLFPVRCRKKTPMKPRAFILSLAAFFSFFNPWMFQEISRENEKSDRDRHLAFLSDAATVMRKEKKKERRKGRRKQG